MKQKKKKKLNFTPQIRRFLHIISTTWTIIKQLLKLYKKGDEITHQGHTRGKTSVHLHKENQQIAIWLLYEWR